MRTTFGCILAIFGLVSSLWVWANDPESTKIVVIHSYSMDYEWTAGEDFGIDKAFEQFKNDVGLQVDAKRFFLEGKKNRESPRRVEKRIEEVKAYIQENRPAGVILTDDLAFSVFYKFLLEQGIPITFCGINGLIEKYGYKTGDHNVTGTLERYNLIPTLKIISQLRPSVDTVIFIGDISLTTEVLFSDLKRQDITDKLRNTPIQNVEFFAKEFFDELQDFLLALDPQKSAVVYMAPYTYTDRDGNHVNYREVDKWTSANTEIIDAGITNYQVKNGRLLSLASNQVESGHFAATALLNGLVPNKDLSNFEIRQYLPLQLILNMERAKKLKLDVPFSLLSYSYESKKLFETFDMP